MRRCALPRARWRRRRRQQRSLGARPISNGLSRCSTQALASVGRGSSPSSAPRAWERAGSPPRSRRGSVRPCDGAGGAVHAVGRQLIRADRRRDPIRASVSTNRPMKALSARRSPRDASAWPTTPTALPRPLRHSSPGRLRGPPSSCSGRCDGCSRRSPKTARSCLLVDDVHWAEPALLDLVEHIAEWARGGPMLVLALARPELRERRPTLLEAGGPSAAVIVLGALDDTASAAPRTRPARDRRPPRWGARSRARGERGQPLVPARAHPPPGRRRGPATSRRKVESNRRRGWHRAARHDPRRARLHASNRCVPPSGRCSRPHRSSDVTFLVVHSWRCFLRTWPLTSTAISMRSDGASSSTPRAPGGPTTVSTASITR